METQKGVVKLKSEGTEVAVETLEIANEGLTGSPRWYPK